MIPHSHNLAAVVDIGGPIQLPTGSRRNAAVQIEDPVSVPENREITVEYVCDRWRGDADNLAAIIDPECGTARRKRWGVQIDEPSFTPEEGVLRLISGQQ